MKKLFFNGKIYTLKNNEIIDSFLVEEDKIIDINCSHKVLKEDVERVDLEGKVVLPGFHDSHMHFLCYAIDKEKVDFFNCESIDEMAEAVKQYIEKYKIKPGEWIQGGGWNENNFANKKLPSREELDKFCPENPVIFTRACCSVAVVNTLALKKAGIFDNQPKLTDGAIIIGEDGKPSGMLHERARFLVYDIIPKVDKEYLKKLILDYQKDCLATGLTTIQTDDFKLWDANYQDILEAYFELEKEGKLDIRVIQQIRLIDHESLDNFIKLGYKTGDGSKFFKIGAYKLLPDGSLGGKTAALREGYVADEENKGILTYTKENLYTLLEKAHKNGMQLAMHAIGDRAMDVVIECYEEIIKKYPVTDPRFRIIHCQITTEDIIEKFKENDILADIQPLFVRADMEIAEELLGKERAKWSYNWKTLIDKGIHVAGSSDAPVESFNPILGIYSAVTRKNLKEKPENGWMPEQKLTVQEAINIYTQGSAYSAYEEKEKGMIEKGYLADFIVLSKDIFEVAGEEIKNIEIEKTYVGGKLVYKSK